LPPFNNAADQFVDKNAAIIGWGDLQYGKYNRFSHRNEAIILTVKEELYSFYVAKNFKWVYNCKITLDGSQPNALQQATVKIISKAKCNEFWGAPLTFNPVFNQQICAGADGKDVCSVSIVL
jgi:hypothetical protein